MEVIVDNLIEKALQDAVSYKQYRADLDNLVEEVKSGNSDSNDPYLEYRLLNQQRMKRLDKNFKLSQTVLRKLKEVEDPLVWWLFRSDHASDIGANRATLKDCTMI